MNPHPTNGYAPRFKTADRMVAIRAIARSWGTRQWTANEMIAALAAQAPRLVDNHDKKRSCRFVMMDLCVSGELKTIGNGAARRFTATKDLATDQAPRPISSMDRPLNDSEESQ